MWFTLWIIYLIYPFLAVFLWTMTLPTQWDGLLTKRRTSRPGRAKAVRHRLGPWIIAKKPGRSHEKVCSLAFWLVYHVFLHFYLTIYYILLLCIENLKVGVFWLFYAFLAMEDLHVQPAKPPTNVIPPTNWGDCPLVQNCQKVPQNVLWFFQSWYPHVLSRGQLQNDDNYLFHPGNS